MARTTDGAQKLLQLIEARGQEAEELAAPLKMCAPLHPCSHVLPVHAAALLACAACLQFDKVVRQTRTVCRLANAQAADLGKLGVRGTLCNGTASWDTNSGAARPIWFVFSGECPTQAWTCPAVVLCPDCNPAALACGPGRLSLWR